MESLQDRINRMHAWQEQKRREEEKYKRNQEIRLFINNCDDIRLELRGILQRDSKMSQLEQIRENEIKRKTMKDVEDAWIEVHKQVYDERTLLENFVAKERFREGVEIQDFQKEQMSQKREDSMKIYKEFNDENEVLAKMQQEDQQKELEMQRDKLRKMKIVDMQLRDQIEKNEILRKQQMENDLKLEQQLNRKIAEELQKQVKEKQNESEDFRRSVFDYLENFVEIRRHCEAVDKEKEKLAHDIHHKFIENQFNEQVKFAKERRVVNDVARLGQVRQIREQEKYAIEAAAREKAENLAFNEREASERRRLVEESYQKRISAYRYGRELMEQKRSKELQDLTEKQKFEETLMLAEKERERFEKRGHEFAKSYQDVLPLHPNLLIMQQGLKYKF